MFEHYVFFSLSGLGLESEAERDALVDRLFEELPDASISGRSELGITLSCFALTRARAARHLTARVVAALTAVGHRDARVAIDDIETGTLRVWRRG